MKALANDMLVKHTTLGVGKVIAVEENAVHVFFPDSERRSAAKLRLPDAQAFLSTDGFEANSWLAGLSAFELDPKTHRYALAASWLTPDEALEKFLALFPAGFTDPAYLGRGKRERAALWRAAHEAWAEAIGQGAGEKLIEADDVKGLVKRALAVDEKIAPLHPPGDESALKDAFAAKETTRAFFNALVELLSVPSPSRARFEKLFASARDLPVEPAQQWLVATLFPFVASPGRQVLLRPKTTCEAAERLGWDLRYDPSPNWATYDALRSASARLLETLKPNGAQDFVDVESFLHVTAAAKRSVRQDDGVRRRAARPRAQTAR